MASDRLDAILQVIRNPRFWIIVALFVGGILLHYYQQLPIRGLETPSTSLGLTRHTIERVYLLAPIIYAGFTFGIRGGIASLAVALGIMLPRAILFSPSPVDALFETGGVIGAGIAVNLIFHMHRREREHVRATDALLRTEDEKWRCSFNALEDVMIIIDRDYNIEKINDSGLALLGKSREEVIGEKCYQIISGADSPIEECPCKQTLETKQVESSEWYDEKLGRYFSIKSAPILNENGEIVKFVDLRHDITELKRVEEMLSKIVDGASIPSFVINKDHKVTHWNTAIESLAGIKKDEVVETDGQWRTFYAEKRPTMADLIVDGASADEIERYYRSKGGKSQLIDGAYEAEDFFSALGEDGKWLHFTASPIKGPDGQIIGAIETLQDITERKRAEEELRRSEEKYRSLILNIPDVAWTSDENYNIVFISPDIERITGYTQEEEYQVGNWMEWLDRVHPDDVENAKAAFKEFIKERKPYDIEYRFQRKDGRWIWIHERSVGTYEKDGELYTDGLISDITERKRAEHALSERVKELQCLYDIGNIAQRPEITLDELYQEVVNLLPKGWQFPEITCARIATKNKEFKTKNYRESEWKQSADITVHRKNEGVVEVHYLEDRAVADEGPFLKEERLLIDAVAERLGRITERKRIEEALQESERSYRELFEDALDAIWVHDLAGNILKANKATEKLTGLSAEELAKDNVKAFLSEEGLRLAGEVRRKLLKGEAITQPYEQHLVKKDGTEATLRITTSPIFSDGKLAAFQNIARDITEEKQMQENLRYYLHQITKAQEEERKRIARELHDSTAQTLIALLHQLENLLDGKAAMPVREAKALWSLYEQIRDVLREVRRFSRDLRPSILDDLGLLPALEWVTGELQKEYGVKTTLKVTGNERRFSPEAELTLFRIVQEALRNIAKHAQASKAEVNLEFEKEKIQLTITDDGIGFEPSESLGDLLHAGKLGLAGIQERVQLLGGSLKLKPEISKGTTIVVNAPI